MSTDSDTESNEQAPTVLQFVPFNNNGEVIIEEIWNMELNDELIVFGYIRQFESLISNYSIIPQTISYSCLAFYANGNALDRNISHHYDYDPTEENILYYGKFSMTYKCIKCGILNEDDELNEYENNDYKLLTDIADTYEKKIDTANNIFVLKKLTKKEMNEKDIKTVCREIEFLKLIRRLQTKNIPGSQYINSLMDLFEDTKYAYIITQFCNKDNLWTYIEESLSNEAFETIYEHRQKATKHRRIMKQMLEGVQFLHANNILHLALHPLNILLHAENNECCVQIIKFYDSRYMDDMDRSIEISCFMARRFIAPEIINGYFDNKSDVWSIGVIFFLLHFGFVPFLYDHSVDYEQNEDGKKQKEKLLFEQIKKGFMAVTANGYGAWFPETIECDDDLKDLIGNMLQVDTSKRFSVKQCLKHRYFQYVM